MYEVFITGLDKRGSAKKNGLVVGDVIIAINDIVFEPSPEATSITLHVTEVLDKLTDSVFKLTFRRDGEVLTRNIKTDSHGIHYKAFHTPLDDEDIGLDSRIVETLQNNAREGGVDLNRIVGSEDALNDELLHDIKDDKNEAYDTCIVYSQKLKQYAVIQMPSGKYHSPVDRIKLRPFMYPTIIQMLLKMQDVQVEILIEATEPANKNYAFQLADNKMKAEGYLSVIIQEKEDPTTRVSGKLAHQYQLVSTLSLDQIILQTLFWLILITFTLGLALPFFLYYFVKMNINNIRILPAGEHD